MRIYFDHNATTPVDPAVAETIARVMTDEYGNASSVHHFGQRAKAVLAMPVLRSASARSRLNRLTMAAPSRQFCAARLSPRPRANRGEPLASSIAHERYSLPCGPRPRGCRTTLLSVDRRIVGPRRCQASRRHRISRCRHNEIGTIPRSPNRSAAHRAPRCFTPDAGPVDRQCSRDLRRAGVVSSASAHKLTALRLPAVWIKRGAGAAILPSARRRTGAREREVPQCGTGSPRACSEEVTTSSAHRRPRNRLETHLEG